MSKVKIISPPIADMPWEAPPKDMVNAPMWRYSQNPIIKRNPIPNVARVFNSAVMYYGKDNTPYIGVFRGERVNGMPYLYLGRSQDGLAWEFDKAGISFVDKDGKPSNPSCPFDPRLIKIEDTYYIVWCHMNHGSAVGMAWTKDFKTFTRLDDPLLPHNRNAVLFPRKINDRYVMMSRPSDTGHTPFGDIFLSESNDLEFWGKHRFVMGKGTNWWEDLKIGGGPVPIETSEGWLLFYHGVQNSCNGFVYSIGGAILDINDPSIVKYRSDSFLFTPEEWYETNGNTTNVCFPCATLCDPDTGRIAIYYGAADTYVAVAFTEVDDIVAYIKAHSL